MIKPENLKKVAEYMGYEVTLGNAAQWEGIALIWNKNERTPYNPIQNSDQCLELMERLLSEGATIDKIDSNYWIRIKGIGLHKSSNSINEAVTLAAIAYVEGLEKWESLEIKN